MMKRIRLAVLVSMVACSDRSTGDEASAASETGAGGCDPALDNNPEHICCGDAWVDPRSDALNCGGCGTTCSGATSFCDQGTCAALPCSTEACEPETICCGVSCCDAGTICCTLNGPVESGPGCVAPTETGTCPAGCAPLCRCAAPETPIATPNGERPIASLAPGDIVYSIDDGAIVGVPILEVRRVPAEDHHVAVVILDDGRRLRLSPDHPLADGRPFSGLTIGSRFGAAIVRSVEIVPYDAPFTYDIFPSSSTATYFVEGEPIASTMSRE